MGKGIVLGAQGLRLHRLLQYSKIINNGEVMKILKTVLIVWVTILTFGCSVGLVYGLQTAVAGDKKPKVEAVDSTSAWIKRTDAIRFLTAKREELKQNYIQQDAMIAGQIEAFQLITQDSVKIKK